MTTPASISNDFRTPGQITRAEIYQQPELWPTTLHRVSDRLARGGFANGPTVITGAGTSAYAATAIAAAWPESRAVPSTDLLLDAASFMRGDELLVSIARSGDSPESAGVVGKIQREFPSVRHLAITCNADGKLARMPGVEALLLDPRSNDKSLVMTSSFSNLVLGGLAIHAAKQLEASLPEICRQTEHKLPEMESSAQQIARSGPARVAILASSRLWGAAREAGLKILEMTAGGVAVLTETFLGLRHGPMSFLRQDSLVLAFLSGDAKIRRYEVDVLEELRGKKLGKIVAIGSGSANEIPCHELIGSAAQDLPDELRTPFDIVFPQLLAFHLSLRSGLDPDNPSPQGVINRVVQGVRIHEA
jgi:D-galactosamine 6-phosphate deaminase/isomerase